MMRTQPHRHSVLSRWCGTILALMVTISLWSQEEAPAFEDIPFDITVHCSDIPEPETLQTIGGCTDEVAISLEEEHIDGICQNEYTLVRTWTATDSCGNNVSVIQLVSVIDRTEPIFNEVPADMTIASLEELPDLPEVTATDACVETITVHVEEQQNDSMVIRTFSATDPCGNTATHQQTISIWSEISDTQNEENTTGEGSNNENNSGSEEEKNDNQDTLNSNVDSIVCNSVTIEHIEDSLSISSMSTTHQIVKIFSPYWEKIYECIGDCPPVISLSELEAGEHHIDIQLYDENWQQLCHDQQRRKIENTREPCEDGNCPTEKYCNNAQIQLTQDTLMISNLDAPVEIVKVFDADWNLIYDCFGDCEDSIMLPDLQPSMYHTVVNFYGKNWQRLCEFRQDAEILPDASERELQLDASQFLLKPNPAINQAFINLRSLYGKAVQLRLFNQFGQQVWQRKVEKAGYVSEQIDVSDLDNGLYWLQISVNSRRTATIGKKLVINKLY